MASPPGCWPKKPVDWARFESQFANRVVSTLSVPDLTLTMPPQQTVTVTLPPVETQATTAQPAPATTASGGATTAPVP